MSGDRPDEQSSDPPGEPSGDSPGQQSGEADERRRFPRLRSSCRIRVKPIAGAEMLGVDGPPLALAAGGVEAMTVNISGGGLCYLSETAVEEGDFLAVELALPEFASPIVALARAAFCKPQDAMHEIGIEFWWVGWGDESAQRAISGYIKTELGP